MKIIYLDSAATTRVSDRVVKRMLPFFSVNFGNPTEPHRLGINARFAIESSRKTIANFLNANPNEIIFTSCATESINLAIKGTIESKKENVNNNRKPHIITSSIEHKAVLETLSHLDVKVTHLPTDKYGLISVDKLHQSINRDTILVSIMYVNNEVGTLEPIRDVGLLLKKINIKRRNKIYFHTDATQATQYFNCDVKYLNIDMMSFSGHKIGAPKGIGVLYKKSTVPLIQQLDGGGQEFGLRSGTENTAYIVGLGEAIKIVAKNKSKHKIKLLKLNKYFSEKLLKIPGIILTGHPIKRSPHIVSCLVSGAEGESTILHLSDKNIFASTGSACSTNDLHPSHVLTSMKIPPHLSHGSLRFSLTSETTKNDIDYTIEELSVIINKLRNMAPQNI